MTRQSVHRKFQARWSEYKPHHGNRVCKWMVEEVGLAGTGYDIDKVRNNWPRICEWLSKWEGKT